MGEWVGVCSVWAMRRFLCCCFMYFISQHASWGSETEMLNRTELWQQRRPVPEDLDLFQSLNSNKLHSELKCGVRSLELENEEDFLEAQYFSRIIGGRDSAPGRQPWQVSVKLGLSHFCGGSLIHDHIVVTAAHCVVNLGPELVKNLIVTVGEYDLRRTDKGEQNIPVSKIIVHPAFNRFGDRNSDIALLYLKYRVKYGHEVQPICLPHKGDTFEEGMFCVVSGWGKASAAGALSSILQEVDLPIIDSRSCSELLEALNLPSMRSSMLCAGFPDGGKDACQGDSGGPLACRRDSGIWTLAGVTSWGIGCGKGWLGDQRRYGERGSPSIFANVAELWDFVAQNMVTVPEPSHLQPPSLEDCNSYGMLLFGESGHILHPRVTGNNYLDNSLCIWNITVPEDKFILVRFIKVDIEDQVGCDHDYVTFHSGEGKLIGKVCGHVLPSPLLIDSNRALVTFVSDSSQAGGGFEFLFTAVHKASEAGSGCGSIAVLVEEGKIDTANYPGLYPSFTKCHWLIEAPMDHVIKLEFEDFAVEISQDCIYDAVVVFGDAEEEHQLALLCGFSIPSPVWSSGNILLIHFQSDGENNFRGFKARFAFFPSENSKAEFAGPVVVQASSPRHIPMEQGPAGVPIANTGHDTLVEPPETFMNLSGAVYGQGCLTELALEKPRGSITSPCCTPEHAGEVRCLWVLRISPRGMAKMTLKHLLIPEYEHCKVEFFAIYEESQRGRKTLVKLCGFLQSPMSFLSKGPVVKMELRSTIHAAFAISYIVFREPGLKMRKSVKYPSNLSQQLAHCRDAILTAQEGIIQSPSFPNGYSNTASCRWRIVGPLNSVIQLDFLDLAFEKPRSECRGGLSIYEEFDSAKVVVGHFCDGAPHFPLKSHGPMVMLTFNSDSETTMKGFVLAYRIHEIQPSPILNRTRDVRKGCPILDLIPVGIAEITSPDYPHIYPSLLTCTWTVYSASGNRLKAVIKDLQTEETKDCVWDSLNIYDGPDCHSEVLGRLCGQKRDLQFVSSGSYLTACFKTDGSVGDRGFKMVFEELNQGPAQRTKNGIELKRQCPPGKLIASEARQCGIPPKDPFLMEEKSANTSKGEQGKPRLIGGSLASPKTWPWLVSLQYENEHFCAGTLVDESWVLTAGHCNFSVQTDKVILGITYLLPTMKGRTEVLVKTAYLHSNFSGFPSSNDLILLELEKPTQTGDTTRTICLPNWDEEVSVDANCLTAGWGTAEASTDEFPRRLQQTKMDLLTNKDCAKYWGEDVKNTNICGRAAGSTSCAVDFGGPLICKMDGRYKVVGVVNWASDNCNPESPTVYTRISAYRDWISTITNGKV